MKIVIIEDESLAQQELIATLHEIDSAIEIVICLKSVTDSVQWLRANPDGYDLLLMDIELADGQSFEIFEQVQIEQYVIFLTAYDEYAIRAFKVNSIDYLLKPVEHKSLKDALQKFQHLKNKQADALLQNLQALLQTGTPTYKERFMIQIGDTYQSVAIDEVAYFFSDEKTSYLMTHNQQKFLLDQSLNELQTKLNPQQFFRVSRKYIIHIQSVKKVSKYFNSRLKLKIKPVASEEILISRVKVPSFLEWIGND